MLSTMDIVNYVKAVDAELPPEAFGYYPNEFPDDTTDSLAYIRLYGGFTPSEWTEKRKPSFQIVLRAKHPAVAETKANAIYGHFRNRREFAFGNTRVVSCRADQSAALYIGRDGDGRYLYSVNFTFTTI